jgi:adenylate cyclase
MSDSWSTISASRISIDSARDFLHAGDPMLLPCEKNLVIAPWLTADDDPVSIHFILRICLDPCPFRHTVPRFRGSHPFHQPPPPSPPPRLQRPFGLPHKASFSTFAIASATNLLTPRTARPSEAQSIAESSITNISDPVQTPQELRKKSSMFSLLKKSRSKPRLRAESERLESDLVNTQVVPSYASGSLPFFPSTGPPSPPPVIRKREKFRVKKKSNQMPPPLPPKDIPPDREFKLDTNIDEMDGIIDLTVLPPLPHDASSPSSGLDSYHSSGLSHSDCGFPPDHTSHTSPIFSNPHPFLSAPMLRPTYLIDHRKVSPKTIPVSASVPPPPDSHPSWTPPESWSVEKEGEDPDEPGYSSSEGSVAGRPLSVVASAHRRKSRRRTMMKPSKPPPGYHSYKIRIFCANTSHHVVSIGLSVTVAELTPVLNQKLLSDQDRETHKLYLKERGRGTSFVCLREYV